MKITLVEDWRRAWRWISVQCMAAGAALQGAWLYVPVDMKAGVPPEVLQYATGALFIVGFLGRFVQQTPPACPVEDPK